MIPWADLAAVITPFYPKAEGAGRPAVGVERMLRIHFLQHWFNLSDQAVDEALYDSRAMRQFVGIDPGREPVPDETTICKFRHLLESHQLGEQLFTLIRTYLAEQGVQISRGTIVDATIIAAPSSTKNRQKARDPEMHQTKKGNQWYFSMKAHVGVDSRTKLCLASTRISGACCLTTECYPSVGEKSRTHSCALGLARMSRRASAIRHAWTRRWSVRSCPSENVSGCATWRRWKSALAVRSGSASSQRRTRG